MKDSLEIQDPLYLNSGDFALPPGIAYVAFL